MGSPCRCDVVSTDKHFDIAALQHEVDRLEQKYSRFIASSVTSAIGRAAASGDTLALDDETAGLLDLAAQAHHMSAGLFDITAGPLSKIWDFKQQQIPNRAQIDAALRTVGWQHVQWCRPHLSFDQAVAIDFGGVVKEYAVDCLITLCKNLGAKAALINLGGDVACFGSPPESDAWRIGIQSPLSSAPLYTFAMRQGAIASSGDYERMFEVDGKRYSHIINPKTGMPVADVKAVSVISHLCVLAGIVSTSAMLKGKTEALTWLDQLELRYVLVDSEDRVFTSTSSANN